MSAAPTDAPSPAERAQALGAHMLQRDARVPTSALGRLWRAGRSAIGVASLASAGRKGDDIDPEVVARVVERLGTMKGVMMKAGQMLGYVDTGLPESVRAMLATLQTAAPITPYAAVVAAIEASLGQRAAPLVATLSREPVAVASVGQVHHATLPDVPPASPCPPDGSDVAVKVRHPGVEDAFRADFRAASFGRAFATMAGFSAVGPVLDEARQTFLAECDYALEAEHQRRFAELFAGDPEIVVPPVVDALSTRDVLVTRWIPGRSFEDFLAADPSPARRNAVGAALYRFWVGTLYREGLFHADPHPGNFAFLPDGRVVIYDYGCVRRFPPELRRGLAALAAATRADDTTAMAAAVEALGGRAPTRLDGLRRLLRGFFAPLLVAGPRRIAPDEGAAARVVMSDKRAILGLELPPRMLFLFRLRFGLYAILARLGAEVDWAGLEADWASTVPGLQTL